MIEKILEFADRNPWKPKYPRILMRRFLTELISSEELIFDVSDEEGRVATAVLLDKVNNPANDACLEVLSMRAGVDEAAVVGRFIDLAKVRTPKNRSGFQIVLPVESSVPHEVLIHRGLGHYFDSFEMERNDLEDLRIESHPEISEAVASDGEEIYRVLCESFAQNPDTSIPEEQVWKERFLKVADSFFYVWRSEGKILGFANLIGDEIRVIGVLLESRGQGIGKRLLKHCLEQTYKSGAKTCHLSVAVTNSKALQLYFKAGFKTVDGYKCYRMELLT